MDNTLEEMPLFPLRTVLFPGMPLPLHVFEERYKLMIDECQESGRPFGVVLIKSGQEVGGPAVPHAVGTSAIITQVNKLEGGRLSVVSVGYQRFRIQSMVDGRPFPCGLVETMYPVDEDTEGAVGEAMDVRALLEAYMETLGAVTEHRVDVGRIPTKPALLAFLTAILMQVPLADKQRLLATESIPAMLRLEKTYLRREKRWLAARIGAEFVLDKLAFSTN